MFQLAIAICENKKVYFLLLLSQRLSPIFQAAKQQAVRLSLDCVREKVFVGFAHTHNL